MKLLCIFIIENMCICTNVQHIEGGKKKIKPRIFLYLILAPRLFVKKVKHFLRKFEFSNWF